MKPIEFDKPSLLLTQPLFIDSKLELKKKDSIKNEHHDSFEPDAIPHQISDLMSLIKNSIDIASDTQKIQRIKSEMSTASYVIEFDALVKHISHELLMA